MPGTQGNLPDDRVRGAFIFKQNFAESPAERGL